MSLYHKNLTSLDALRQEKKQLQAKAEHTIDNVLSTNENNHAKSDKETGIDDIIQSGLDFLNSKGILSSAIALAIPIFDLAKIRVSERLFTKVSKEVLGNYIKWETLMLVFKLATGFFAKKSQEKTS